jgi:hypothetical protein
MGDKWARNTVEFMFRMFGILVLLLIAEIFTDFDWIIIWAGMGIYYVFFCSTHTPRS